MKFIRNIATVIFCTLLITSCSKQNNDCASIFPVPPEVNISIVDSEGNSLIGEDKTYKPSEITLTRGNQSIPLSFNEYDGQMVITMFYPEMESGKDYLFKLNDQETDTLNVILKKINGECFDTLSIEGFFINGVELQFNRDSYSYVIIK